VGEAGARRDGERFDCAPWVYKDWWNATGAAGVTPMPLNHPEFGTVEVGSPDWDAD